MHIDISIRDNSNVIFLKKINLNSKIDPIVSKT